MSLDDELREALGGPAGTDFDYDALVAGTKARASRIRRRRTAQRVVTAAVLAPVLVGTGWLVGTNLSGQTPDRAQVAATSEAEGTDGTAATTQVPAEAPFQDPDLLAESTPDAENEDVPNAWEIPDVRPTGVEALDTLGVPLLDMRYPRIMPLDSFMVGNDGGLADGVQPLAGASWMSATEGDSGEIPAVDSVTINVTGWEDSADVLASLPTDVPVTHAQWLEAWTQLSWDGADAGDLLLTADDTSLGHLVGAVVRQGDYLVGVSVRAGAQEDAVAVATQVAERTAANLAALDPAHARE